MNENILQERFEPIIKSRKQKKIIKDNSEYIIMLKDTEVCSINRGSGVVAIYKKGLMPYDIYLEDDEYADGVDDAMGDLEDEGELDW